MSLRRGPLSVGERVQLTDRRGRRLTVMLEPGGLTQTDHGLLPHEAMIGLPEGSVVVTISADKWRQMRHKQDADTDTEAPDRAKPWKSSRGIGGWAFTVMRPRLEDYILSMPRGAQIMYPKDVARVILLGDIRPGMRVLESGAGSGAMSLGLLDAIGPEGKLTSIERREEFARVAMGNATVFFGHRPAQWDLRTGDFDTLAADLPEDEFDRIVLDMLDPWNRLQQAYRVMAPGGVLTAYVTTTTQLSRLAETLRADGRWTEPEIMESLERSWKADGLAVRPEHEMIGHTGFLLTSRAMAPGQEALRKHVRATKDYRTDVDQGRPPAKSNGLGHEREMVDLEDLELRRVSDRKLRKVLRDLDHQVRTLQGGKDQED
ncbi:tRNA (adenine-N1)-methyltransferase [Bifidobacterium sp. W8101]|uniref:tRNA (adenine-N1)-methyltransferase n=1 Tax=Bifidobacterium TaxID=1678 RepID=UPI0018DB22E8|nr:MULTISPECIES: tRNA (adenine-N1)-methyltransferase [Bifidobacterium]MBI0126964.1 tRNA (adenine-N1)-methyltransferase [Bifidobacterium choladohabitans]MBI0128533.1 tRNA (adenine-N1)-methyltransferase [Bifidobacterium sp. W8103]MBI0139094.1 tRNA (adenine-N1)-methyltransferase [Bifidobacterium sp. W8105]MBI0149458.1 tRNA (adenine-N1)-methyltransferase [Bifidobacterium sp. W8107]